MSTRSDHTLGTLLVLVALAVLVLTAPSPVSAYFFPDPTDAEWAAWPEFCRARLARGSVNNSDLRRLQELRRRIPAGLYEKWKRRLPPGTWRRLHHYCTGIIVLNRGRGTSEPKKRHELLRYAENEGLYAIGPMTPDLPLYAEIAVHIAEARRLQGNHDGALDYVARALESRPNYGPAYAVASLVYRDVGKEDKALEILQKGDVATKRKSAQINYFLGLIYLDRRDYEKARIHARRAYRLGSWLPGLKRKLVKLGQWSD